jgi:Domain of unknown function (DUF4136)
MLETQFQCQRKFSGDRRSRAGRSEQIRGAAGFSPRAIRDARGQRDDFISAARHRFRSTAWQRNTTMRRPGRLALFTAALAASALSACATMNVSSHIEQGVDFAQFRTWDFGPADALPAGDPRLDNNPFFKDYLEGAVGKALEDRHYVRSASGTPDLLVHYHANISKTFDVNGIDSRDGNCYDNCEPRVIEYEQGTIVLDVVDTQTNRLVWRGWAQDGIDGVIDNQNSLKKEVTTAVARMMERFPRHL